MIDITNKKITKREASAKAIIFAKPAVILRIKENKIPKGDCFATAKVAAILAVKNTPNLIPMCHPVKINFIGIDYKINKDSIDILCTVKGIDKTGFEMESLVGASICALTIYDMCKMIDCQMFIAQTKLIKKSGGKSGTYIRVDK